MQLDSPRVVFVMTMDPSWPAVSDEPPPTDAEGRTDWDRFCEEAATIQAEERARRARRWRFITRWFN